jgi:hypothetical protein
MGNRERGALATVLLGLCVVLSAAPALALDHTEAVGRWNVSFSLPGGFVSSALPEAKAPFVGYLFQNARVRVRHLARPQPRGQKPLLEDELRELASRHIPGASLLEPSVHPGQPGGGEATVRECRAPDPAQQGRLRPCLVVTLQRPEGRFYFFVTGQEPDESPHYVGVVAKAVREMRLAPRAEGEAPVAEGGTLRGSEGAQSWSSAGSDAAPDRFVTGAREAQAARLAAVPFEVLWHQPQDGSYDASLDLATDGHGCVRFVLCSDAIGYAATGRVHLYAQRSHSAGATNVSIARIQTELRRALRDPELVVRHLSSLDSDAGGNLYFGVDVSGARHEAFLSWRHDADAIEVLATPERVAQLSRNADGVELRTWAVLRPAPQGDAWLVVHEREIQHAERHRPLPRQLVRLRRSASGRWDAESVPLRFEAASGLETPAPADVASGAPDAGGGWIFFGGGALWRADAAGRTRPLARLELPAPDSAARTAPVVLENGDVWLALSRKSSVTGHGVVHPGGAYEERNTWFLLGDRSRWVRLRLDGRGGIQLAEIDGQALLDGLRKAGARLESEVVRTKRLKRDHASGGLAAWDAHHDQLFVIRPLD